MSKKESPPTIIIKFFDGTPKVNIHKFENLTPGLLDRANDAMHTEWNRERAKAITQQKTKALKERREAEAKAKAEAEKEEEPENA